MLLIFMMQLQELMQRMDAANNAENYDLEETLREELDKLRDKFHVDFQNEYGFGFDDFEETVNLSYDYVC